MMNAEATAPKKHILCTLVRERENTHAHRFDCFVNEEKRVLKLLQPVRTSKHTSIPGYLLMSAASEYSAQEPCDDGKRSSDPCNQAQQLLLSLLGRKRAPNLDKKRCEHFLREAGGERKSE
jgi:hypothetical protein